MRIATLALASTALVASTFATAQDWKGLGRLSGKVSDTDGKPLEGVRVRLELPERGGGTTITTGKNGRWALLGVAAGSWNIDFSLAGYTPRAISVTLPSESARLASIDIELEKAAPAGPSPELARAVAAADEAYKAGRWAEARAEYQKVLAQEPELAGVVEQQIGFTYIQEKDFPAAVDHLEKAVAADPANQDLRAIAAQAALEGKLLDRARGLLSGLDRTRVTQPDVFFNVGVNFLNGGDVAAAIEYFGEAIRVDPTHVDAYYRRALGYLGQGRNAEARADFQKVLELQPEGSMADLSRKALEQIR